MARETWVQSQVESYQRLKKWYLMPPCLTLSIIRYGTRVKWSNPGKGVAPSPTPWCSKLSKREPSGHPRLWSPTLLFTSIFCPFVRMNNRIFCDLNYEFQSFAISFFFFLRKNTDSLHLSSIWKLRDHQFIFDCFGCFLLVFLLPIDNKKKKTNFSWCRLQYKEQVA